MRLRGGLAPAGLGLLLAGLLASQAGAEERWMRNVELRDAGFSFTFSAQSHAPTLLDLEEQGFILAGHGLVDGVVYHGVLRLNADLSVRWARRWLDSRTLSLMTLHPGRTEGTWLVTGHRRFDDDTPSRAWMAMLDDSGTVVQSRRYPDEHSLGAIGRLPDSGWLVGSCLPGGGSDSCAFQRLSADWEVLWTRRIPFVTNSHPILIAVLENGNYLIGGRAAAMLWVVTPDGDLVWVRRLEGLARLPILYPPATNSPRPWLHVGCSEVVGRDHSYLLRFDGTGELEGSWLLDNEGGEILWILQGVVTGEDSLFLVGNRGEDGFGPTVRGDVIWGELTDPEEPVLSHVRPFPGDGERAEAAFRRPDGSITIWGQSSGVEIRNRNFLARVDPDGSVDPPCVESFEMNFVPAGLTLVDVPGTAESYELEWEPAIEQLEVWDLELRQADTCCRFPDPPSEVYPPGSATGLRLRRRGAQTDAVVDTSVFAESCWWNYHEGTLSELRAGRPDDECLASELESNFHPTFGRPRPGGAYVYVTGQNLAGRGSPGSDSLGRPREESPPCP